MKMQKYENIQQHKKIFSNFIHHLLSIKKEYVSLQRIKNIINV